MIWDCGPSGLWTGFCSVPNRGHCSKKLADLASMLFNPRELAKLDLEWQAIGN